MVKVTVAIFRKKKTFVIALAPTFIEGFNIIPHKCWL